MITIDYESIMKLNIKFDYKPFTFEAQDGTNHQAKQVGFSKSTGVTLSLYLNLDHVVVLHTSGSAYSCQLYIQYVNITVILVLGLFHILNKMYTTSEFRQKA